MIICPLFGNQYVGLVHKNNGEQGGHIAIARTRTEVMDKLFAKLNA